ncbi:hypothetical protein SAMN04489806_2889 [Paramicrobacterium humi]|uniref:AbiEi antitoxin C-terminal domain-containing protein n=1 Tax=Paramicrobacterium humi TaxID=640635 RepID=A0A1H4QQX1_9MICO|nr:hypothetical protein [Microbacterium humi]SEC21884.1 hypothetical protein SAMN04489806_2889 [Microbacterium humi]
MPRLLPTVIHAPTLPLAVLSAAKLDGQLWEVFDGYSPVDEPDRPELRALALLASVDDGDIIVGRSAAWVLGAMPRPVLPIDVCGNARRKAPRRGGIHFRELLIDERDVLTLAGRVRVTGRERTIRDIAFAAERMHGDTSAVIELCGRDPARLTACVNEIAARGRAPGKVRALDYLAHVAAELSAAQPPLTR